MASTNQRKTMSETRINPRQEAPSKTNSSPRKTNPPRPSRSTVPRRTLIPAPDSVLGKRQQSGSRENSRDRGNATRKRRRQKAPLPLSELCEQCSRIPWDKIDDIMSTNPRIDFRGKAICEVGTYYRNISRSTTCSLCLQLYAPWIEPFIRNRDLKYGKLRDNGDRIVVFPHLRHIPHVNDFPSTRRVLRQNNTPYHLAVVPIALTWVKDLKMHIARSGLAVIMPRGKPESDIFTPQKIPLKFDPEVVRQWIKFCGYHTKTCKSPALHIKGMRLIDCEYDDLPIRPYEEGDKYVALSYVWGKPAPNEKKKPTAMNKKPLNQTNVMQPKTEKAQSVADNIPPKSESKKVIPTRKIPTLTPGPSNLRDSVNTPATSLSTLPVLRLPKDIPLTIRDAIKVTKDLGYRYLWVDKYCIDQINATDKEQQISHMGDIYGGAQLTIFALGEDANFGLPGVSSRPRLPQRRRTIVENHKIISTMRDPHLAILQSKWSTRGWTYQEGLFSTRRLFFTDHQVYYECNSMNCSESFNSNLVSLHIQSGQRFRAFHRAGRFVCGNSNPYSHVDVKRSRANHRKVDTIRRCQYQIRQYTKRELTNKNDVLNAFSSIASFYAKTNARIISISGLPIPFPIANLNNPEQEWLDYLSYALAWTHRRQVMEQSHKNDRSDPASKMLTWDPNENPVPQRRGGYPSWSWAGWFGEIGTRNDLPYCWTSHLSSAKLGFRNGDTEDYMWLKTKPKYKHYLIRRLLLVTTLQFDAFVMDPSKLDFWLRDSRGQFTTIPSPRIQVYFSIGPRSRKELHEKLMEKRFECLVLGTYGQPRKDIHRAIIAGDKKGPKYKQRRIEQFEPGEPDGILCLVVRTINGMSYRLGLLKIELPGLEMENAMNTMVLEPKRHFTLA